MLEPLGFFEGFLYFIGFLGNSLFGAFRFFWQDFWSAWGFFGFGDFLVEVVQNLCEMF